MIAWRVLGGVDAFRTEVAKEAFAEDVDKDWVKARFDGSDDGGDEVAAPGASSWGWTLE